MKARRHTHNQTARQWTIRSLLQRTAEFLESKGIPAGRLNAEVLLAHAFETDRLGLYLRYDTEVPQEVLARFRALIQRRIRREPLQYITGVQEFWSLPFRVKNTTLIPRPESEHVIEVALRYVPTITLHEGDRLRVLDLGTGCGNLAVALCKELPSAWIVATDLSGQALAVAMENATRLVGDRKVSFVQADLFEAFHPQCARFHMILANPPYVPTAELARLEPEVRDHEPRIALDGGPNGMDILNRIISHAPDFLCAGGYLIAEIGSEQGPLVVEEVSKTGRYARWEIYRDFAASQRVLVAQRADR